MTSDAGLLLPRELDERLGLSTLIEGHLSDPRTGHNRQFPLPDLVRQSNQWYPRREWPVSPTPHRQNGLVGEREVNLVHIGNPVLGELSWWARRCIFSTPLGAV